MHCEDEEVLQWETFCSCVNKELQKQIKKIIGQDAATPYDISKFDLEEKYPVSILFCGRLLCKLQEQLQRWKCVPAVAMTFQVERKRKKEDNFLHSMGKN